MKGFRQVGKIAQKSRVLSNFYETEELMKEFHQTKRVPKRVLQTREVLSGFSRGRRVPMGIPSNSMSFHRSFVEEESSW